MPAVADDAFEVQAVRFIVEEATSYVLPWDEMQVCSAIVGYRRG